MTEDLRAEAQKDISSVMKWNFTLNGGAYVSILALMGQTAKDHINFVEAAMGGLGFALAGILLAWLSLLFKGLGIARRVRDIEAEKPSGNNKPLQYAGNLIIPSMICFMISVIWVVIAVYNKLGIAAN